MHQAYIITLHIVNFKAEKPMTHTCITFGYNEIIRGAELCANDRMVRMELCERRGHRHPTQRNGVVPGARHEQTAVPWNTAAQNLQMIGYVKLN